MANYREADVTVDAYQFDPTEVFPGWCISDVAIIVNISAPNGNLVAEPTDWIVKYGDGTYKVVKDADFSAEFVAYP